jgi:hypothetical protein
LTYTDIWEIDNNDLLLKARLMENEPMFMELFNSIFWKAVEMGLTGAVKTKFGGLDIDEEDYDDIQDYYEDLYGSMNKPILEDGNPVIKNKWSSEFFNDAINIYLIMRGGRLGYYDDSGKGMKFLPPGFLNALFERLHQGHVKAVFSADDNLLIYNSVLALPEDVAKIRSPSTFETFDHIALGRLLGYPHPHNSNATIAESLGYQSDDIQLDMGNGRICGF